MKVTLAALTFFIFGLALGSEIPVYWQAPVGVVRLTAIVCVGVAIYAVKGKESSF